MIPRTAHARGALALGGALVTVGAVTPTGIHQTYLEFVRAPAPTPQAPEEMIGGLRTAVAQLCDIVVPAAASGDAGTVAEALPIREEFVTRHLA